MLGLVLAAATAAPTARPAADPDPKSLAVPAADLARAKELVEKLASPHYAEREEAQAALAALGRKAAPALADGIARHPSAEARARCQALYPRARAADLAARLAAFAADSTGKFEHDIPGWAKFRDVTRGGPAARAVYAELVAAPVGRELVLGSLSPPELGARIAALKTEMTTTTRPGRPPAPKLNDVMALMYAESRLPSAHNQRVVGQAAALFSTELVVDALTAGDDRAKVYRAVAGHWVDTREGSLVMTPALTLATAAELPEGAGLAARMMTTGGLLTTSKATAAMWVAKAGDPKHVPALEKAFADAGAIGAGGLVVVNGKVVPNPAQLQVRDVALVAAVLVTKQDPGEYGFEQRPGAGGTRFVYSAWSLPADKREAAFARWQEWRAANPAPKTDR